MPDWEHAITPRSVLRQSRQQKWFRPMAQANLIDGQDLFITIFIDHQTCPICGNLRYGAKQKFIFAHPRAMYEARMCHYTFKKLLSSPSCCSVASPSGT
eukprot:2262130-Amphidinium_carterae.1